MELADVLIIGGGPAGLTAALYAARKELTVKVVSMDIGGQMLLTSRIENYPGYSGISGFELSDKMEAQVKAYPVDFVTAGVKTISKNGAGHFVLELDDGTEAEGKTLIITAGKHSRTLGIPGESEFTGRGVSYCATCDAPFYRKKTVAVVGGGDSAVQGAIELSRIATHVTLLVRSRIRAQEILVRRLKECTNVDILMGVTPEAIKGDKKISSVVVKNKADGTEKEISVDGLFVEAGGIPNTNFVPEPLQKNSLGEIVTDKRGRTNIPGLFAAGDVTDSADKQIVIAAGEGAAAALAAHEWLLNQ